MQNTKFRLDRAAGHGEEDFQRVFTIYAQCHHLGHVTSIVLMNFHFIVPKI